MLGNTGLLRIDNPVRGRIYLRPVCNRIGLVYQGLPKENSRVNTENHLRCRLQTDDVLQMHGSGAIDSRGTESARAAVAEKRPRRR
jgi:hypothetical protein